MYAIILNGSLKHQHHLIPIQKILEEELGSAGWSTEPILLNEVEARSCIGCFKCWDTTPGLCIQKDEAQDVVRKIIQSDLVIFMTPLTFGGYSSELKKIIERMLGLLQPGMTIIKGETHHLKRYECYPSLLAIGVTKNQDDDEKQIFNTLIERHSFNFYPPKHRAEVFLAGEEEWKIREEIKQIIVEMELNK
ncbi:MAG: flavodoxin family protein [Candidatus Aminicenantes bacterium]|nr:MAG: flavodoxin family protein [Candidatus Aminicenantes bacterium]